MFKLTFVKHRGLLLLPITSGLSLQLPVALHANKIVSRCLSLLQPLAVSLLEANVLSGQAGKIDLFHQHCKYSQVNTVLTILVVVAYHFLLLTH